MWSKHTGTDGRIHGWEFSFSCSPPGYSSNTGQETILSVPDALLHLLQFSHPVRTKPATSEQSSVTLLSSLLFHIPHWYQKYLECILTSSVVPLYAARCPFTLYPVKGDGKLPTFPNPLLSQQDSWVRHGSDNSLRYTDISQSRYYCQNPKGFKN